MKTYDFKTTLFEYFNQKAKIQFPILENRIFRERLKINQPEYPYVILKSGERTRINKRFECFRIGNTENIRVQYRLAVTFGVHDLRKTPSDAERFSDELIDYIEQFFINDRTTHVDLEARGIVVNELLCSGVRDMSQNATTSQEFIKEIDIVFEFEDIQTITSELGQELETNIEPKDI